MTVPLLDLQAQYRPIRDEIAAAVTAIFDSAQFVLGKAVADCEAAIAGYCGVGHAVGMSSGTDALLAALMAENIGPGDEVITTPYSFFATAGSIARVGAKPVFVDIEPSTYNIDVNGIEAAITPRTKAIMPVHLYGQMAAMRPIMEIARRHNLAVIEDAAQAIGAEMDGRRAGSIGDYGCFSFFPSKNLGCAGDGGMTVTADGDRAERLAMLRNHGSKVRYYHSAVGGNFRLDAIQAAVVHMKLKYLDGWTEARRENARRYRELFRAARIDPADIEPPMDTSGPRSRHIYNQFVIRVSRGRDGLKQHLQECGVGCEVYYPVPLHLQQCFTNLGHAVGAFPESERAARETLALPIYSELTDDQAGYVVASIKGFLDARASRSAAAA